MSSQGYSRPSAIETGDAPPRDREGLPATALVLPSALALASLSLCILNLSTQQMMQRVPAVPFYVAPFASAGHNHTLGHIVDVDRLAVAAGVHG
jgi:hypothetical protein